MSVSARSSRVAALLALVAGLAGCSQEEAPVEKAIRPVKAIKVADVTRFRERAFPGQARATQEVELSFRVAGPLITLPVKVGDRVEAGDVLARIDPRDFEVDVRNVRGQLAEAQAALTRGSADLARLEKVYRQDPGATSEAAIDRAREARDRARANVASLQASLKAANDHLEDTNLRAPFAGSVVATYVENFEDVRAKQPVVRIVDDSRIEMVVNIPESMIALAPKATDLRVVFDAFPDLEIPAEIKEIGTEASEITRTYPITLIMDQPDGAKILPGMAGKATGEPPPEFAIERGQIEVPLSAVFSEADATFVWILDEASGQVTRREIVRGPLTSHGIRVASGLERGEWVVTAGVHYLTEGQAVRLLADSSE